MQCPQTPPPKNVLKHGWSAVLRQGEAGLSFIFPEMILLSSIVINVPNQITILLHLAIVKIKVRINGLRYLGGTCTWKIIS